MASKRTVLITGCSEGGLGDYLARAFQARGLRVIATARNPTKMQHLKSMGMETLTLDVTSAESIRRCVQDVAALTGGSLDMLVNNAGAGLSLPLTDVSIDAARELFDLNVWSVLSMVQAFLPLLRQSTHGAMVVNNTSIASIIGVPIQGVYNASKAAAASLSETMRLELQPFGITVVDMKTGAVRTSFFANMKDGEGARAELPKDSIYNIAKEEIEKRMDGSTLEPSMMEPETWAARAVGDLLRKTPPATVWRGGSATLAWFGRSFFPYVLWDRMLKQAGGLDVVEKRLAEQAKRAKH